MRNFLFKLGEDEQSQLPEKDRLEEALSELSPEQLEDFQRCSGATPRFDRFREKIANADRIGREMAHEQRDGLMKEAAWQASAAKFLTGKAMPAAGKVLGQAAASPRAAMALGGAGVGAIGGALKNPGVDPQTGQKKSRLGNIAVGAGLGAGAGAALGHSAGAVKAVQGLPGKVMPKMQQLGTKATAWGQKAEQAAGAIPKAAPGTPPLRAQKPAPSPMAPRPAGPVSGAGTQVGPKATPSAAPAPSAPAPSAPPPAAAAGAPTAPAAPQPAAAPQQLTPTSTGATDYASVQRQQNAAQGFYGKGNVPEGVAPQHSAATNARFQPSPQQAQQQAAENFYGKGKVPEGVVPPKKKLAAICARYGVTKTAAQMTHLEWLLKQADMFNIPKEQAASWAAEQAKKRATQTAEHAGGSWVGKTLTGLVKKVPKVMRA